MSNRQPLLLLVVAVAGVIVSGIAPHDRLVWVLEVAPIFIGLPILIATYWRFRLTPLLYWLLLVHALILALGAHYTYAQVPLGHWVQDLWGMDRNPYDRLGHLAQGFIPAILAREILLRRSPLVPGKWLFFLVVCISLAFSAFYEMLEWWAAVVGGGAADAFLGTQGDVWDTQWDMFLALVGSVLAQVSLGRYHDRQLMVLAKTC